MVSAAQLGTEAIGNVARRSCLRDSNSGERLRPLRRSARVTDNRAFESQRSPGVFEISLTDAGAVLKLHVVATLGTGSHVQNANCRLAVLRAALKCESARNRFCADLMRQFF